MPSASTCGKDSWAEAARNPERLVVIDAGRSIEEVHADVRDAAQRMGVALA